MQHLTGQDAHPSCCCTTSTANGDVGAKASTPRLGPPAGAGAYRWVMDVLLRGGPGDGQVGLLHRCAHHARRARWKLTTGPAWPDTGLFFVQPDGQPWHPEAVTWRFECLVRDAGLPPIRLHDLRHCAATFLKAAGADLKDVQELLGHSSITITGDTYTSVIAELDVERAKAQAAANLAPRRRRPAA